MEFKAGDKIRIRLGDFGGERGYCDQPGFNLQLSYPSPKQVMRIKQTEAATLSEHESKLQKMTGLMKKLFGKDALDDDEDKESEPQPA